MGSAMKFLVLLSAVSTLVSGAPQLVVPGYGYGLGAIHAVPTVAKQTITYKTAAFEPVAADTPADTELLELKETEHSYDTLVPGPVTYHHTPAVYGYGLHGGVIGAPYGIGLHGLPVLAAPAAEVEEEAE